MSGNVIASSQESLPSCPHARNTVCDKNKVHCRVRRLIVVASLYFKLKGVKNPSPTEMDTVNTQLHLACSASALMLPAAISAWIWRKNSSQQLVERFQNGEVDLSTLSNGLTSMLPRWFQYGDGSTFAMDVRAVLDCLRTA